MLEILEKNLNPSFSELPHIHILIAICTSQICICSHGLTNINKPFCRITPNVELGSDKDLRVNPQGPYQVFDHMGVYIQQVLPVPIISAFKEGPMLFEIR